MPRDSNGTVTATAGIPVTTLTTISSTMFNTFIADLLAVLTDSLSRSGAGGMLAPFEFDDGAVGTPAATFSTETTSGLYRAGAGDLGIAVLGVRLVQLSTALIKLTSQVTDGATAVGVDIDTANALSTAGAKLLRVLNNAVEKFVVDKDGYVYSDLFRALSAGPASVAGNEADGATAVGVILDALTALSTAGAKALSVRNNGSEVAAVDKDGVLLADEHHARTAVPAEIKGNEADGATAVGVVLDCLNALSTAGALALSVRNNGVEKASIDKDGVITGSDLDVGGLAKSRLAALGQQVSSSSGTFSSNSNSFVDVTNLSVTITTTGRPVFIAVVDDGTSSLSYFSSDVLSDSARYKFLRDASIIGQGIIHGQNIAAGTVTKDPLLLVIDVVGAGTYTYKFQVRVTSTLEQIEVNYCRLIVFEL
jgi:uncharacterized protein YaiE (UPF0345 family)